MTRILQSLSEIAADYDALFCDLWGCVHNGVAPFPDAVAALQSFRKGGGTVVLLTNAPRPNGAIKAQLTTMGLPRDTWDHVVSSGDASQIAMINGAVGRRVYHIGAEKDLPLFTDLAPDLQATAKAHPVTRVPLDQAEGIVCTGLADDLTETPADYRAALLGGNARGLPMLCANPDIIVDMGDKRTYCAGALAADYAEMGGEVLYFGKPHPPIYDLARRHLNLDDPRILCVGDGIATDVQGGIGEGLDTLFITGGIAAAEIGDIPANPDPAKLMAWLKAQELSPSYAMGHLR